MPPLQSADERDIRVSSEILDIEGEYRFHSMSFHRCDKVSVMPFGAANSILPKQLSPDLISQQLFYILGNKTEFSRLTM